MKVLIIDDAEIARTTLKRIVEKAGHEVAGTAINGEAGLVEYQLLKPDLVILDISMPGMDGIECLKAIKAFDDKAKVIMCSALDQKSTITLALDSGAITYIMKPFSEEIILEKFSSIEQEFN